MLEKKHAIVMKTQAYSETHKIVTLFTHESGKIATIARGAKKPKSQMAAITQPFIYGIFFVYFTQGLSPIQQGEIVNSFRPIREDIIKTAYASYIIEMTDKLADSHSPDPFLFNQMYKTLEWLTVYEEVEIPIMMYELKLFKKGGIAPVIDRCVNCGSSESPFAFSVAEGGLLCKYCHTIDERATLLSDSLARLFYIFSEAGLERIGKISVKQENKRFLRNILDAYYEQYGGYYLKTKRFLKQMDKLL